MIIKIEIYKSKKINDIIIYIDNNINCLTKFIKLLRNMKNKNFV